MSDDGYGGGGGDDFDYDAPGSIILSLTFNNTNAQLAISFRFTEDAFVRPFLSR
jgi:hypothetical protein